MNLNSIPLIVLAGGFGTRLRSAIGEIPKPIAPINGRPFLEYLLASLYHQGIRKIILSLHFQAHLIEAAVAKMNLPKDLSISFITEPQALGTGGGILYAYKKAGLNGDVFVCNGDTFFENGLQDIFSQSQNFSSMGLVHVENANRYGGVRIDQSQFIEEFLEKTQESKSSLINMGCYFLKENLIQTIPDGAVSLEKDIFEKLQGQKKIKGIPINSYFIDIGIPEDYERFKSHGAKGFQT